MPTPWTTRIWQEFRAGNLTRAARDVLLTLHTYRGTGGAPPGPRTRPSPIGPSAAPRRSSGRYGRPGSSIWSTGPSAASGRAGGGSGPPTSIGSSMSDGAGPRRAAHAGATNGQKRPGRVEQARKRLSTSCCGRRPRPPICYWRGGRRWHSA